MKLEQLLKIYWSRGLFFGNNIIESNNTYYYFIKESKGLNFYFNKILLKRFELRDEKLILNTKIGDFFSVKKKIINKILAMIISVNFSINELVKIILIRFYLIKTYKGKAQALGKPSRGQRTWSNAWTSYKHNKIIRQFVIDFHKYKTSDKKIFQKKK